MGRSCKGAGKGCFTVFGIAFSAFLLFSAGSPAALLASVLIHEAGHIICGILASRQLPEVALTPSGVRLCYPSLPNKIARISVSAAGPIFSLAAGWFFAENEMLFLYSVSLGIINLLPISGLDGGNIVSAICEGSLACRRIERSISVISILLFFALNCAVQLKYGTNLSLAVMSVVLTVSVLGRE